MLLRLPYGKGALKVKVPDESLLLEKEKEAPLSNPERRLEEALAQPIGADSLSEIIARKGARNACIVVSDHTRPVPDRLILPPVLREIEGCGISPQAITLLIAGGVHRRTTHLEKLELLGEELVNTYRVIDHDSKNEKELAELSNEGSLGAPVLINKNYVEAELKIVTGLIEPHFMTGFSGGRKSICPGIAGLETIRYFHSPTLLESACAGPGILEDNPCHEFASRVAEIAGVDFILNVTLDHAKNITGIFCGHLKKAFLRGAKYCKDKSSVTIDKPVDIVITTNGGYPTDRDFYQTVKGLVGALAIVKKGGTIVAASECCDGVGSAEFRKLLFEMKSLDSFMERISHPENFCIDQWEVEELIKVLRKVRVRLYATGISDEEIARCHVQPVSSVEAGIKESIGESGRGASIAILPDGPYVLPISK